VIGHDGEGPALNASPSVLVVEDEAVIRGMLAFWFEDEGFDVHEADSADQAVALFEAGLSVQSVVTDVRMPGQLDGLGLAAWMREHRPNVPIVITSGHVVASEATTINPAVVAVITKPYRPSEVAACIPGHFGTSIDVGEV
jgi:CheY-like chemotaxis protein